MKLQQKLILSFLSIILLVALDGYLSVNASQNALRKSIGEDSVILSVEMLEQIDRSIYHRMVSVMELCCDSITQKAAILSNEEFEKLDDIPAFLEQKDNEWTAVPKNEITPFMQKLLNHDLSQILKQKQNFFEKEYGYKVFAEIFVTNQYGANVAQTNKTTDYYQADESWWQTAQKNGLYVSNVEYDRSAAVYSTDICLRINDQNGNFLGVVKAVLNINETIRIIKTAEKKHAVAGLKLLTKDYKIIYATEKHKFLEPAPETFTFLSQYNPDHQLYSILEGNQPGDGGKLLSHTHSKGYKNYPGLDWILVIEYDTGKIFAPVTKSRQS